MDWLWMLLIGLVVGVIAKMLMPGKDPKGCILTMLLGIVGAFVGGYLGQVIGLYKEGDRVGFIASVVGAMLVLLIFRAVSGRRAP